MQPDYHAVAGQDDLKARKLDPRWHIVQPAQVAWSDDYSDVLGTTLGGTCVP